MTKPLFNPFPKYLQVRDALIRRIGSAYMPGTQLPTEHVLCKEFGVSRETIREALAGLEEQGLIYRQRGRGTFVKKLPEHNSETRLTGLVEGFTELGFATESSVLEAAPVLPPRYVAAAMRVKDSQKLYRILRLRYLEGDTFALHDAFLPMEVANGLLSADLEHTTLFEEISRTLGCSLQEDFQSIDAAVADADASARLKIPMGAPLLIIRRVFGVESKGAHPPLFFESAFRSDRYYYTVQLKQASRHSQGRSQTEKAPS